MRAELECTELRFTHVDLINNSKGLFHFTLNSVICPFESKHSLVPYVLNFPILHLRRHSSFGLGGGTKSSLLSYLLVVTFSVTPNVNPTVT